MSFAGTLLGFLASLPLSISGTRSLFSNCSRGLARFVAAGIRTIPVLLWAIVFVILVGLGPLAGTFGIAAYTVGYLAKIYSDLFEGTDPEVIEAVGSTGASKLQLVRFVFLPEAANAILTQLLFMLEYNIRASSILGFVGAGGLGFVMQVYLQTLNIGVWPVSCCWSWWSFCPWTASARGSKTISPDGPGNLMSVMSDNIPCRSLAQNRFGNVSLYCRYFFSSSSPPGFRRREARRLVALLDYLGSDYKNAVQDGKIVNQDEYTEMQEFSKRNLELLKQLKETDKADKAGVEPSLKSLANQIENKADPKAVAELANGAKQKLIATYNIVPYPKQLPSLASGKKIYLENCAQCHGETGKGDGPSRATMNPKIPLPANFTDAEFMAGLSPFKAFNAVSFGVENTAMASFAALQRGAALAGGFLCLLPALLSRSAKAGALLLQSKNVPGDLTTVATLATSSDEAIVGKTKALCRSKSRKPTMPSPTFDADFWKQNPTTRC